MSVSRELEEALAQAPVIAIIRGGGDLESMLTWLAESPIRVVEITTNTPGWQDAVKMASSLDFDRVGVGTVVSLDHVRDAHKVGATFTVAPGLDAEVVRACRDVGLDHLPGVMSPSEVQAALGLGLSTLKLFPAGPLGVEYLRGLRGPFDQVRFIPTGGVSIESAADWLVAGAFAVGLGGALAAAPDAERAEANRVLGDLTSQRGSWK